jgi:hypothetical protein
MSQGLHAAGPGESRKRPWSRRRAEGRHTVTAAIPLLREWRCGGLVIAVDTKLRVVVLGMIENAATIDISEITAALSSAAEFAANVEAVTVDKALPT